MRISDWSSDVCSSDLRVAQFGEAFEVGEDAEDVAPLAVQRELVGVAQNLRRDVGGQIFAERRLREGALARSDRARRGADRGLAAQPADRPGDRKSVG